MTQRTDLHIQVFNEDKNIELIRPMSMDRPGLPDSWVFNAPTECLANNEHGGRLVSTNLYAKNPQVLKCLCYECIKVAKANVGVKIHMGMPVPRLKSERGQDDPLCTVEGLLDAGYVGVYSKQPKHVR
jgi:hypothetical protein